MKKNILVLFAFLLLLCACNHNPQQNNACREVIPINPISCRDISEVIEQIEISPLQTNEKCLVHSFRKLTYCKELDKLIILDKDLTVFIFSMDGTYIADSKLVQGAGPGEYYSITDVIYNPYSGYIELLDPLGTICCYDTAFRFIEKKTIDTDGKVYLAFTALDKNKYIMLPAIYGEGDAALSIFDYQNQSKSKPISFKEGFISTLTMNYNPFFTLDDDSLYFSTMGLDYYFYKVDDVNCTLQSTIYLDFGNEQIDKRQLKKMFRYSEKQTKNETAFKANSEIYGKINQFLLESKYPIPVIKFFDRHYVYVHLLQEQKRSNFIYNRYSKTAFLQTLKSPFKVYFCIGLKENVLIALAQPFEVEDYIAPDLMSESDLLKIRQLQDDDNPVIIKYHLR